MSDSDSSLRVHKKKKKKDEKHKKKKERHRSRSPRRHRSRSRSPYKKKDNPVHSSNSSAKSLSDIDKLREEKELMKTLETPEEKRARRLAKKEAKTIKHREKMGWDEEYLGYTNCDNPFGDNHLLESFTWKKKMEKEGNHDLTQSELQDLQRQKTISNKIELEKVKKSRLDREKEREVRDKERETEQRDKESAYYNAWERQEDSFHLTQAKLRSNIRIEDGRAKPIDLLAKYITSELDDLEVEMHEPYFYLNGLTITDLEDLLEDIKVYVEIEESQNMEYWHDISTIVEEELANLRKIDPNNTDFLGERRSGINSAVAPEVVSIFKGKSLEQLDMLENQIKLKISMGQGVDISYWESLLQHLRAHTARQRLREKHQNMLQRKLFKLKQEQGITESNPLFPIVSNDLKTSDQMDTLTEGQSSQDQEDDQIMKDDDNSNISDNENDQYALAYSEYEAGSYSPKLLNSSELDPDVIVYDHVDDMKRLDYSRKRVLSIGQAKDESEKEFEKKARENMGDDEAQFSVEVPLEKHILLWTDKYRPRKPRFFNRVHTGFEWNKYNQTHYDIDNPPPKIVQGYKFNIFYPDLINKSQTPEYYLTPEEGNEDFSTLRFHAGPPYEDIAFRVVNREWEYSYKRGFRCQFHNNIFQLWYHFKRYRYRR